MKNLQRVAVLSILLIGSACTKEEKVKLPASTPAPVAAEATKAPEVAATAASAPTAAAPSTAIDTKAATNLRVSGQINSTHSGAASFKVAGHISKILVQEGTRVRKGQVLAQLDEDQYRLSMRSASEKLEQARRDLRREEQLRRDNATTDVNLERVKHDFTLAQIGFEEAQRNVRDTRLESPYDAVVAKKIRSEGEHVAVGVSVFELSAIGSLEVSIKVPESLFTKVKVGQILKINVPSINLETQMKISRIVPVIESNSRTFTVIGKITDPKAPIMPGQFVEAQI